MTGGPFEIDYQDINVVSSGDIAFVHALEHCVTVDKKEGRKLDTSGRASR